MGEKMKFKKISIGLGSIGIFTILIYIYKFFIKSDFTSMWVIGCGIGFGLIFVAYLYSWMKHTDLEITKLDNRIDSFSNWFIKNKELN
jgi:hypothetical protein